VKLEAYLFFPGDTEEAMNYYHSILGGDLSITRNDTSWGTLVEVLRIPEITILATDDYSRAAQRE